MNKHLLLALAALFAALFCFKVAAQQPVSEQDRNRYVNELRGYKHKMLAKELELTKEQQQEFFALYDQMEDSVMAIANTARQLETQATAASATAAQIENATEALYSQKLREGEVELQYYARFKDMLTPQQLLALKSAERKFNQQLMRTHRRMNNDTPARNRATRQQKR